MNSWSAEHPCVICGGHDKLPQGQGRRCWGALSSDGTYAVCTRENFAGAIQQHPKTNGYHHRLNGPCRCGTTHGAEVHEIGEARSSRIVATYDYTDEFGNVLYQVVRWYPKTFRQRTPNGRGGWIDKLGDARRVPYRLPELIAAVAAGDTVYICEGEKDVEAVRATASVATCNSGGAEKWDEGFQRYFNGAKVVIVRDRDEAGTKHARKVYANLRGVAASLRVVEASTGKDAADHLAAGKSLSEFVYVWPIDTLRTSDPVAWKRALIHKSLDPGEPFRTVDLESALNQKDPTWPTGIGEHIDAIPNFRGVTILTGAPSSGKSFLAIASAVQATYAGWDVLYLSSEMGDSTLMRRVLGYAKGKLPEHMIIESVSFGASVTALVDLVAARVAKPRLLVVFDSLSSFVDQAMVAPAESDVHQIGPLRHIVMWAINVKRHTEGEVSFLLLSETNRDGATKGRFGDHKADLVLTLKSEEDRPELKEIRVTKGWEYRTGVVGLFKLDYEHGLFERIE